MSPTTAVATSVDASPAPTPKYRRLTQQQLVTILEMHKLQKTQVEIAEVIGCDHRTIGRALERFTDSTIAATAHLRANALRMAQNIVRKGLPRDHVQALRGVGVLAEDHGGAGVIIQIGIKDSDVTFASHVSTVTHDLHRLTWDHGSDNGDYVVTAQNSKDLARD